jgi:hypothetical protein
VGKQKKKTRRLPWHASFEFHTQPEGKEKGAGLATYSSGARGGEQKRKAAEENKMAKGEQKGKAAEELNKKKLQITLSAHFKYSWTGHKPSWGLLDLAPILLGQIHF